MLMTVGGRFEATIGFLLSSLFLQLPYIRPICSTQFYNLGFYVVDDISFLRGKQISHQNMVALERDDRDFNLTIFTFRAF